MPPIPSLVSGCRAVGSGVWRGHLPDEATHSVPSRQRPGGRDIGVARPALFWGSIVVASGFDRASASNVRGVRVGVLILPDRRWKLAAEKWRRAEALGFDHVWTYDHVVWDGLGDSPWFGAVPTLAAAGLVTERIRVGTLVASPNFRHPVPFARELMTLDDITGGRITAGIGAGSRGSDASLLGHSRGGLEVITDRFSEFVDVLDQALRGDEVTYRGRHWDTSGVTLLPGCVQRPRVPFAVAASVPRSMDIAVRHGSIWVTNGDRSHRGPPLEPLGGPRSYLK